MIFFCEFSSSKSSQFRNCACVDHDFERARWPVVFHIVEEMSNRLYDSPWPPFHGEEVENLFHPAATVYLKEYIHLNLFSEQF